MWKNLKSIFSNRQKNGDKNFSADFDQQVRKAIHLFDNRDDLITDEDVVTHFTKSGIGQLEATEILLFLPVAFVRQWLSTVTWPDTYLECNDGKRNVEKKYLDTEAYQIIWQVTTAYFNGNPNKDTVLKIGGRSAEFNAINQLLHDNPSSKLEEIKVSQTVFIR